MKTSTYGISATAQLVITSEINSKGHFRALAICPHQHLGSARLMTMKTEHYDL